MKTEHILIMRFSAFGDVAMTVPVVYSLAKQYPHLRITVLSKPFARTFFEELAPNVGFMEADVRQDYKGIRGLNTLFRRLTAKNFTAIADLHRVLRTEYIDMRFTAGGYKVAHINKHRSGKCRLTSWNNKKLCQQPTAFENYSDVFAELGYPITPCFTTIFENGKEPLSTLPHQIGEKQEGEKWIGVAPFAAWPGKVYPLDMLEKAMTSLAEKYPKSRFFLFGAGQKEHEKLNELAEKVPNAINASALMAALRQELVLMSWLDVMISMDSANMHLASLTATPVVSVWGATHPFAGFMGWNQPAENAIGLDLPCRPCSIYGKKPCQRGDFACMKSLNPQLIVNRVDEILSKKESF